MEIKAGSKFIKLLYKMKIAFVSYYSGIVDRGMETVVSQLAQHFNQNNDVLVIQAGENINPKSYQTKVIKSRKLNQSRDGTSFFSKLFLDLNSLIIAHFSWRVLTFLKQFQPDIVFACNGGWQALILKIYCLINKSKLVISGQAGIGWDDRWNLILKPDLFIALTERNYKWSKSLANNINIALIPNGVDCQKFNPDGKKISLNLPEPIILCVAGPEKYKRVRVTIDAVVKLEQGSLLLIRAKNTKDSDILYATKKLKDRFSCREFSFSQMPEVYRSCDLFTLVSMSSEAFGISYLEAMASNLSVIAPNDLLRQEIVGDAGILVDEPIEVEQYAKTIKKALDKKWDNIPRQQAIKFDWNNIAKSYLQEFEKLIDNKT
ncbi:hypothetical protein COX08_04120 [Candidatus Beckwithbacteria bacterium CG23_combo_of_CG06-09_8_20_14_all_34_8]|uniref:Glycosyl transferase family 1 domain-containing protein n=1 Tax=Candidatus Beckwithbacteria bacterium CG23_combo_of_CG06-09_8_20_14_all_34_8 TaxID=1974497 RepID=A0A2H0B5D0_9BACT|nr:MAG: hypothetical protein COX08_04120 [Candidatus Beckwithbacteria bacterium CG23_combo_of_CG06-09_8_20_14_all_34_8]